MGGASQDDLARVLEMAERVFESWFESDSRRAAKSAPVRDRDPALGRG